ncbi:MAG: diaminopropionate ammonia-lyase [Acidobacteria bacterium]|nr:diaminopropionate ammonia-lyase [Acidobacteriota bacterium]
MNIIGNPYKKTIDLQPPNCESINFHMSLPGYKATDLKQLNRLSAETHLGSIFCKDEGSRFGLKAFKVLGASFAVYKHLYRKSNGGLRPDEFLSERGKELASDIVFTTATDGNHGRAVAWTAQQLGRPAFIYMLAGSADARIEAIRSHGAEVIIVDGVYDEAVKRASEDASLHNRLIIQDTAYPGYTDIPIDIEHGYSTMFEELRIQINELKIKPDIVFLPAGVGTFAAAGVRWMKYLYPEIKIIVVEPEGADCFLQSILRGQGKAITLTEESGTIMAGLNCGTPSITAWEIIRDSADFFIAVSDDQAREAMRRYADEGVVSGESGSAGLAALLAISEAQPDLFYAINNNRRNTYVLLFNTEADTDPEMYKKIVGTCH